MLLRTFMDPKLAQYAYLVGCQATGEAVVIDPARDIEPYLQSVESAGLRLVGAVETHIHADFLSGARELAARTGATLFLSGAGSESWRYRYADGYPSRILRDGDRFTVGRVGLQALFTPGHTPEHLSYLLTDHATTDRPMGLFSGDFVFVGDVGRPDLLERAAGMSDTARASARDVFASLDRFRALEDHLQVWPAHGAGSACGKDLGAVPSSTVGYERRTNWALQATDVTAFVTELLDGQPEPPRYFATMKARNRDGPDVLGGVRVPPHLPHGVLADVVAQGRTVVDTRPAAAFATTHIAGTLNLPMDDDFPTWAGWLLRYDEPLYLIVSRDAVEEAAHDLHSIGLDNASGFFDASVVEAWESEGRPIARYRVASPKEVAPAVLDGRALLLDVRAETERRESRVPGSEHVMLGYLPDHVDDLPRDRPVVVHCAVGSRSAIAAALLQSRGVTNVVNLLGGIEAWQRAGLPVETT
jgi:hydroxyacylglutathione hydrolase